jgi:hypothetical protein
MSAGTVIRIGDGWGIAVTNLGKGHGKKIREGRIADTLKKQPKVFKKVSIRGPMTRTPHVPKSWRNATMEHVTCVPRNPTMFHAVSIWNNTGTLEQAWNIL